jgi:hypothetical protein
VQAEVAGQAGSGPVVSGQSQVAGVVEDLAGVPQQAQAGVVGHLSGALGVRHAVAERDDVGPAQQPRVLTAVGRAVVQAGRPRVPWP